MMPRSFHITRIYYNDKIFVKQNSVQKPTYKYVYLYITNYCERARIRELLSTVIFEVKTTQYLVDYLFFDIAYGTKHISFSPYYKYL